MARIRVPALQLTAALVTQHTINTGVEGTFVEFTLTNHDTVERLVEVHFVPSGGSASDANQVVDLKAAENALQPGEMRRYQFVPFLKVGDFIQMKADVTLKVTSSLSVLEEAP